MTSEETGHHHLGGATFGADVYLPFDRARPVAGSVATTGAVLVVAAAGEQFELVTGSAALALGGHNGERVVLEGEVGPGSPRAGERLYLQCPDLLLLAHLAAHGPHELRATAARLSHDRRAASRRWRLLFIAAAAAIAGIVTFLFFGLDALVKRAVSGIPLAWENALGESLLAAITLGQSPAAERDAAVVKAAFERLRPHAGAPGCAFEYAVVASPEVNAFALPGCKFVVYTGLLARAGRPEEVAGVLAHEFQHAVLRHSLQKMVRAAGLQAVLELFVGDLEGLGGTVRSVGLRIQELSYGRDQEREADLNAIDLLAAAGIDPAGLPDFFDRLAAGEDRTNGGTVEKAVSLLSTHPASAERGAALRAQIARRGAARYEPLLVP